MLRQVNLFSWTPRIGARGSTDAQRSADNSFTDLGSFITVLVGL